MIPKNNSNQENKMFGVIEKKSKIGILYFALLINMIMFFEKDEIKDMKYKIDLSNL